MSIGVNAPLFLGAAVCPSAADKRSAAKEDCRWLARLRRRPCYWLSLSGDMINPPTILDAAHEKLTAFGPDLGLEKKARLQKEFPELNEEQATEVLAQIETVSKTVCHLQNMVAKQK